MYKPLAARLRPTHFDTFVGQTHLIGEKTPLRTLIEKGMMHSMLLWGPPGSGKTTLAELIANYIKAEFISISAVFAGVKDIREAVSFANKTRKQYDKATILFIDEIHRFNKAQQDALLPFVENGIFYLIGATTENPSFEINNSLLSRCRVYVLEPLKNSDLTKILNNALTDLNQYLEKNPIIFNQQTINRILVSADGDARRLLNIVEIVAQRIGMKKMSAKKIYDLVEQVIQQDYRRFDKNTDIFYEQISALHKSVRGTSPDAGLYWLCRMLDGGCDPLYIGRRLIRMASEDIGNADPNGLAIALHAVETLERLGRPEGDLALAQAVVYLACAPKSIAVYEGFKLAMQEVQSMPSYGVPIHLRNAPTPLMKKIGFGREYRYDPKEPHGFAEGQLYFPDAMGERQYYFPSNQGIELKIKEKLLKLRRKKSLGEDDT